MNKVKVIKKNAVPAPKLKPKADKNEKQLAAREMVTTVTSWVSDFQQRKRVETKVAIEKFFSQPRTSES